MAWGHLQAVAKEVGDALDAAGRASARQLLELDGDPAVPEAVAVGDAELGGIIAVAPEAQGRIEREQVAAQLPLFFGPGRRRRRRRGRGRGRWRRRLLLAFGEQRPEVFAVGQPERQADGLIGEGGLEELDDLDTGFEVVGMAALLVDVG